MLHSQQTVSMSDWRANGINRAFSDWQKDGGWQAHFVRLPGVQQLLPAFVRGVWRWLRVGLEWVVCGGCVLGSPPRLRVVRVSCMCKPNTFGY